MRDEGAVKKIPGESSPGRTGSARWLGVKAVIVTVLMLSLVIGVLLAAFSLGVIVGAILLVTVIVAVIVAGVSYGWRRRGAGLSPKNRVPRS